MAKVTDIQNKELAKLARAANRRLERATEGQRSALDYYLKDYHTRQGAHGAVFQQGKAKTEAEYRQRMAELKSFMSGEISTRRGWESVKQEGIEKAADTLRSQGYDLTDEELAQILRETGGKKAAGNNFYKALNNVQAAKEKKANRGKDTELTPQELKSEIARRNSEQQAAVRLARIRETGAKKRK